MKIFPTLCVCFKTKEKLRTFSRQIEEFQDEVSRLTRLVEDLTNVVWAYEQKARHQDVQAHPNGWLHQWFSGR